MSISKLLIYVYDPNCPDNESEIRFLLEGEELRGRETCNRVDLMGFFCEKYKPVDPEGFWGEGVLDGS